jgi:uncharacterized protein (UPF0210 family)
MRLATTPFPDWWEQTVLGHIPVYEAVTTGAVAIAQRWHAAGADYISLGPIQLRHDAAWLNMLPALLSATDMLFASAEIADTTGTIDSGRCWLLADVVRSVSTIRPNGFGNLYLTALANCPPGSPFFPVAYHRGGPATFAVAVQAADLARKAFQSADSLAEARENLVQAVESAALQITAVADQLAQKHNIPFHGLDFSLAPFPTDSYSLAAALEDLGVTAVGRSGSIFAAAFITEAVDRAQFRRCGFSGLMLPVLEDSLLALRSAEGHVSVQDLLSYAAVCGVGLDTIPLPGDISQNSLATIFLDVAALATRLHKPLTARLMPFPGLVAGDTVQFDFPYFADSRVMDVAGDGVTGLLANGERLQLRPYHDAQ